MTSADLAERILNWQNWKHVSDDHTPLSKLVQQHHDAVVDECARVAEDSGKSLLKHERAAVAKAVGAIRALRGCA